MCNEADPLLIKICPIVSLNFDCAENSFAISMGYLLLVLLDPAIACARESSGEYAALDIEFCAWGCCSDSHVPAEFYAQPGIPHPNISAIRLSVLQSEMKL